MAEFGSGPSLDENWDLYVDSSSGDLAISDGPEELRKDLAFNVGIYLRQFVGDYITPGLQSDIRVGARDVILSDPRISEIQSIEVSKPASNSDDLSIDVTALTVEGTEIDEVFTAA